MKRLVWVLLFLVSPAFAANEAAMGARSAADQLRSASEQLDAAGSARDRVEALTATVQAYEAGLAAMRIGLRQAAIREQSLRAAFEGKREELSQLLGVLQNMGNAPAPLLLLHPTGAIGTARAGMIVSDVAPAIRSEVESVRADLEEVAMLRQLQESAVADLQEGLRGVQEARSELSQAMSDRRDLPMRFTADPIRTAILIASTETLDAFASGLSQIAEGEIGPILTDISDIQGELPLPVRGTILRAFGEADAAGIRRPGLVVATRPRALVTTPAVATIRYRGPLLDYGNVMILEPAIDTLFVVAGLDEVYGETGAVIPAGTPIGLMGGEEAPSDGILTAMQEGSGSPRTETLYIEVREGPNTVDPLTWFALEKD